MQRKRNIQPKAARERAEAGAWRQSAAPMPVALERRVGARHDLPHSMAGTSVQLIDLSMHGCCIGFGESADYRPGQFIRLAFAGENDGVRAIVRWVEGLRIGAEFTRTLAVDRIEDILAQSRNPQIGLL
jgi:hypothetical protein